MTFRATILTLYPDMFPGPLGTSLAGRALAEGKWSLEARNIRDHAIDKHRTVDDTPAGGGAGMVLRADVLAAAIDAVADGRRQHVGAQNHPRATARRRVVDGAVLVDRMVADVVRLQRPLPLLQRAPGNA
jgi:tRNA (guanine-N1)-methyltransferase